MNLDTLYIIILCLWALAFIICTVKESKVFSYFFILLSGVVLGFFVTASTIEGKPTAIDVYKNKTTLEITYRDGVPIDTVVVFKP